MVNLNSCECGSCTNCIIDGILKRINNEIDEYSFNVDDGEFEGCRQTKNVVSTSIVENIIEKIREEFRI